MLFSLGGPCSECEARTIVKNKNAPLRGGEELCMFDEKDIAYLQEMEARILEKSEARMSAKIEESESRMSAKIEESSKQTLQAAAVLMESYFDPKFELLAESIRDIQAKLVPRSRVDDLEEDVKFLKIMLRQTAERVSVLERA